MPGTAALYAVWSRVKLLYINSLHFLSVSGNNLAWAFYTYLLYDLGALLSAVRLDGSISSNVSGLVVQNSLIVVHVYTVWRAIGKLRYHTYVYYTLNFLTVNSMVYNTICFTSHWIDTLSWYCTFLSNVLQLSHCSTLHPFNAFCIVQSRCFIVNQKKGVHVAVHFFTVYLCFLTV